MSERFFSLVFYVPETHAESTKSAVFAAGGGTIGNYSDCCWQTSGTGQFRPGTGSSPYLGQKNKIEQVEEVRVELICSEANIHDAIRALKTSHPYETPAFHYWQVQIN